MVELLITGGVIAAAGFIFNRRPTTHAAAGSGARMGSDLPCPWCRADTAETDVRCPGCGQLFG